MICAVSAALYGPNFVTALANANRGKFTLHSLRRPYIRISAAPRGLPNRKAALYL